MKERGRDFMKTYYVGKVKDEAEFRRRIAPGPKAVFFDSPARETAVIEEYPWGGDYQPRAYGLCFEAPDAFLVYLAAEEDHVRCEVTEDNGPVCTDSCLEFFFQPASASEDAGYFNFEWNPEGVLHLAYGKGRHGRFHMKDRTGKDFLIEKQKRDQIRTDGWWYVAFRIPFSLIRRHVPDFDPEGPILGKGNFYKCGDQTEHPHWGCYAPVGTKQPDYHRPEYFAELISAGQPESGDQ